MYHCVRNLYGVLGCVVHPGRGGGGGGGGGWRWKVRVRMEGWIQQGFRNLAVSHLGEVFCRCLLLLGGI